MVMANNGPKLIIKKKRGGKAEGHHGGAWKVAYADFVTAMMAFFLMMWLINATTVVQKKGLADYFDSRIPIARVSGGGQGAFGGDSIIATNREGQAGGGGATINTGEASTEGAGVDDPPGASHVDTSSDGLDELAESLEALAQGGSLSQEVKDHLATTVTDKGLVVDIFDTEGEPLFDAGSAEPTPVLRTMLAMVTGLATLVTNEVHIAGHTDSRPFVVDGTDGNWALSSERAEVARRLMIEAGLPPQQIGAVIGKAATEPMVEDPADPRNRRVSITLIRSEAGR